MSGETLTIQLTTEQLERLIRDTLNDTISKADIVTKEQLDNALKDRPTLRHVNDLVKSEIDRKFDSMLETVRDVRDGLKGFDNRFAAFEKSLAILVEQTKHTSEAVKEVKDEQKRADTEREEMKRGMAKLESKSVEQDAKLISQEHAIFGDEKRPGTKSLFDHISDMGDRLVVQMGHQFEEAQVSIETLLKRTESTEAKVDLLQEQEERNTQFRERRQQIENFVIHSIPNAGKRIIAAAKDDFVVKWATRIGLGGALAILAALLERLSS